MKTCVKCKFEKECIEFQKEKRKKDGFTARCKNCLNEDKKQYLDKKREKIREYNRKKYYEKHELNKNKRTENSRKLRRENNQWIKEYHKKWYLKNAEKIRENARKRNKSPENKKKRNEYLKRVKETEKPKIRARKILQAAVKVGYITRPTKCKKCMKVCKPDGHHRDYNKPLEVIWLCKICHNHEHGKLMDVKP